jgi:hypothetical protein
MLFLSATSKAWCLKNIPTAARTVIFAREKKGAEAPDFYAVTMKTQNV